MPNLETTKVWPTTGSTRGFGRALSETVLKAGHKLVAAARNSEHLSSLVTRYVDQVRVAELDVTSEQAASDTVVLAVGAFGSLDVLANNAAMAILGQSKTQAWRSFGHRTRQTSLASSTLPRRLFLSCARVPSHSPVLFGRRSHWPYHQSLYAAAKWGVERFSEVLAKEVRPPGIKVTIVEPGGFSTDFAGSFTTISEGALRVRRDRREGRTLST